MPVDSPHVDYARHHAIWRRIRDVLAGQDAIHAAGERYLPRLKGQSEADYSAYKSRGTFHDAASRTVDGFVGAIFRKPPSVDIPEPFAALADDVTGSGVSLAAFATVAAREVIALGRYGILVDAPGAGGSAFAAGYTAESIVNWREERIDGRGRLTLLVLREVVAVPNAEDPYVSEAVERFRVLRLERRGGQGAPPVYTQTLFEKARDGGRESFRVVDGPLVPLRRGRPLDFIPFQFLGAGALDAAVAKSPIYGLVNANLAHYATTADLKHGAHFTALPTPVIAGSLQGGNGGEMRIGSGVAWQLEEGARWGMLEFSGAGLGALRQIREDEKKDMAVLGARLLEDQKTGVEAARTVALRHRGENSLLAGIANSVARGLSRAIGWLVWWSGGPEGAARVRLNTDFLDQPMSAAEMVDLVEGWQRGGWGPRVVFENLRDGERLPENMSFEDWRRDRAASDTSPTGDA